MQGEHILYAHDAYKQRIVEIDEEGTTRTRCFSGKPCRVIKNDTTEALEAQELIEKIVFGTATLGNDFHISPNMPYYP